MIIFDLDGTLADCEHRRHFIDPRKNEDCYFFDIETLHKSSGYYYRSDKDKKWEPDWKAFYEACDQDKPIYPVLGVLKMLSYFNTPIEIWSGRCESVRNKTEEWLVKYTLFSSKYPYQLKMRPIGDNTPDDQLKERWLDEASICVNELSGRIQQRNPIEFVFDDRLKVIRMWRRRGIFVFNCCQHDGEF